MPLVAVLSLAEPVEVVQGAPPLVEVLSSGAVVAAEPVMQAMLAEQAECGVPIPQVAVEQGVHPQVLQALVRLVHLGTMDAVMVEVAEVTERHLELAEQGAQEVRQAVEVAEAEAQQTGKLGLERQAALEPSEFIVGR